MFAYCMFNMWNMQWKIYTTIPIIRTIWFEPDSIPISGLNSNFWTFSKTCNIYFFIDISMFPSLFRIITRNTKKNVNSINSIFRVIGIRIIRIAVYKYSLLKWNINVVEVFTCFYNVVAVVVNKNDLCNKKRWAQWMVAYRKKNNT